MGTDELLVQTDRMLEYLISLCNLLLVNVCICVSVGKSVVPSVFHLAGRSDE